MVPLVIKLYLPSPEHTKIKLGVLIGTSMIFSLIIGVPPELFPKSRLARVFYLYCFAYLVETTTRFGLFPPVTGSVEHPRIMPVRLGLVRLVS